MDTYGCPNVIPQVGAPAIILRVSGRWSQGRLTAAEDVTVGVRESGFPDFRAHTANTDLSEGGGLLQDGLGVTSGLVEAFRVTRPASRIL